MHRQGLGLHVMFGASLVAGLVSCRIDNSSITAPRPLFSLQEQESPSAFSADVDVTISAVDLKGLPGSAPAQQLSYHLERSKNAGGQWRTVYSNIVLPSDRLNSRTDPQWRVSRLELDDAGRITGFNGLGAPIDSRFANLPASLRRELEIPGEAIARRQAQLASELNARRPDASGASNGFDHFVVDRQKQRAVLERLERAGARRGQEGGRLFYAVPSTNGITRLTVDTALGAIVETETQPRSGAATRVRYEFTSLPSGGYLRSHVRVEREPFENVPSLTVDTRLSNVHVLEREGQ